MKFVWTVPFSWPNQATCSLQYISTIFSLAKFGFIWRPPSCKPVRNKNKGGSIFFPVRILAIERASAFAAFALHRFDMISAD